MAYTPKVLSASGQIKSQGGVLYAVTLTGGSDAATLVLYDEITGSGDQLWPTIKAGAAETVHLTFPGGLKFGVGCYATITGTAPEVGAVYL